MYIECFVVNPVFISENLLAVANALTNAYSLALLMINCEFEVKCNARISEYNSVLQLPTPHIACISLRHVDMNAPLLALFDTTLDHNVVASNVGVYTVLLHPKQPLVIFSMCWYDIQIEYEHGLYARNFRLAFLKQFCLFRRSCD